VSHAISRRQVSLLKPRPAGIVGFAPRQRQIGWLFSRVPAACSALVQAGVRGTNRHPIGNVNCTHYLRVYVLFSGPSAGKGPLSALFMPSRPGVRSPTTTPLSVGSPADDHGSWTAATNVGARQDQEPLVPSFGPQWLEVTWK
jgi:hypothetical protein